MGLNVALLNKIQERQEIFFSSNANKRHLSFTLEIFVNFAEETMNMTPIILVPNSV